MHLDDTNEEAVETKNTDADPSDTTIAGTLAPSEGELALQESGFVEPATVEPVKPEPVPQEPAKLCCICGRDVAKQPRSRDGSGRFWCTPCVEFNPPTDKTNGLSHCPDCGRLTRPMTMVDRVHEKVCSPCNEIYVNERKHRLLHKANATFNPELEIRQYIFGMVKVLIGLASGAALLTLYHFHLLYFAPKAWVPFQSALCFLGVMAGGVVLAIASQYVRIAMRKRARQIDYEKMIHATANHILALDEDSHQMGISEPPEPLRRRIERAITRIEACAGLGIPGASDIVGSFAKKIDVPVLTEFLQSCRPDATDTIARNREIATISYLNVDLPGATLSVTAILLRLPQDQDALTRHALICFRNGQLELAKKIFKRVVFIAKEKNSEVDLAAAYCNLGMLHVMLNEFDDAGVRYSQAMVIYKRISREEGQADCYLNLGVIAFKQKKFVEVEDQLRKAMTINKKRNRREGLSICCSILGMILIEKEIPQLKEAEKLLNHAVRLNLELGRPGGVAAAYGNLGLSRVKRGDLPGATQLFLKAQTIYQRINRPKMTAKIQGMLKTVGTLSAAKMARSK